MSTTSAPDAEPASPAGVVAGAGAMLDVLEGMLWAARTPADLLAANVELERLRSRVAALQARVAVEIEATEAAKTEGWASTADYLTAVAGARRGHGRRVLVTGRALAGPLGTTRAALHAAEVSPEHAEVIVGVVDRLPVDPVVRGRAEAVLLEQAGHLNASELQIAGQHMLEVVDPDGTAAAEERALDRLERSAHLGRELVIVEDHLGGVRLRGRGSVEDGAVIKAALAALSAPDPRDQDGQIQHGPSGRDRAEHGTRTWDALVEVCRRAQDARVLPEAHGIRPRVVVTIGLEDLRTGLGTAVLETGERLSAAALRKLACDAKLIPAVLGTKGEVLDVGRAHRLVTTGLWTALVTRDQHCAFPGCRRPPIACDAHHLVHWAEGGGTALDNLVLICRAHHTTLHATGWQARINPVDRLPEFIPPPRLDPDQRPIRHRYPRE